MNEYLHYVYNYGSSSCSAHYDAVGLIAANDLLQHSIASPAIGGIGPVEKNDSSTPVYFPLADMKGFLVVSTKTSPGARISGEMVIADPATGTLATYAGISNKHTDTTGLFEGDFSNIADQQYDLSFFGDRTTATSWYAVVVGDMSAHIASGRTWDGSQILSNNGFVYNNEGIAYSGTKTKTITCADTVNKSDLMTRPQGVLLARTGGLIHASSSQNPASASASTGLVLMKMQTVNKLRGDPFLEGKGTLHREPAWD